MFWRLRAQEPLWLVEKQSRGLYLNSPRVWSDCGLIRAKDRQQAHTKACFVVGSSDVRVSPADEEEPA